MKRYWKLTIPILLALLPILLPGQSVVWTRQVDSINAYGSPQAADLNGDGTKDIILGGGIEGEFSSAGVLALDGKDGSILWQVRARDQVYITPLLRDITSDGVLDVFIGGRDALFWALNGTDGSVIWEFWPDSLGPARDSGWYNFYNPQWVPDQDQDGVPDLVLANGGDANAIAFDSNRPPGSIMLLSAMNGTILGRDTVPDGQESYLSPLVQDLDNSGDPTLIFGSGGETLRGSLWKAKLSDLKNNDLSGAKAILTDSTKGFIPVPSLTDLNGDQVYDLIVPWFGDGLIALDGSNDSVIWQLQFPGYENYTSPTLGNFTGDPTPDVWGILAKGQWFFYAHYVKYLVDGATGQVVWSDTTNTMQLTQFNAMDWDNDGWDEIVGIHNFDQGVSVVNYQNIFQVYDFQNTNPISQFGPQRGGLNLFSTPLIEDLDNDSLLDITYAVLSATDMVGGVDGTRIQRYDLGFWRNNIAWKGFMGNERDCVYNPPLLASREDDFFTNLKIYPNPAQNMVFVQGVNQPVLSLFDLQGKLLRTEKVQPSIDLNYLKSGVYLLKVSSEGLDIWKKIVKL